MLEITTEIQDKNENMRNCQIRLSGENKSCVIEFEIVIIKYWRIKSWILTIPSFQNKRHTLGNNVITHSILSLYTLL